VSGMNFLSNEIIDQPQDSLHPWFRFAGLRHEKYHEQQREKHPLCTQRKETNIISRIFVPQIDTVFI
ncbi:MAG TPA: hypothetical protein VJY43_05500, partial [Methanocorpusculum sp.]|nr:hypothetical protein [Methanocorpusculum sp.]